MIRAMQKSDWDAVRRIYQEGIRRGATFQRECPGYEQWDKLHCPDCRLVLEEDGRVVGWCALSHTSPMEAYRGVAEVSIYLEEAYQNRGLGTQLLTQLCKESERCGYWSLYAVVLCNNEASYRLHEKCGFRQIGYRERIARDRFGRWQNTAVFERRSKLF